jgi:protein-tyrosine-phosphatase
MSNAAGRAHEALLWRLRCWVAVKFARRQSYRRLHAGPMRRVLVVCYGNIYRSAYAGVALAKLLGPRVEVRSGGFHPNANREPPSRLQQMARLYGVELAQHADIAWADTIVLMDRHNWQQLINHGAEPKRLVWLGALDGEALEVVDPHDMGDAELQAIVDRLHRSTECLAALIGKNHLINCV